MSCLLQYFSDYFRCPHSYFSQSQMTRHRAFIIREQTVFSVNLKTVLTLYLSVTVRCIIRSFRSISGGITELPRMMFLLRLKSLCTQWNFWKKLLKNKVRRLYSLKPMRFSENLILRMKSHIRQSKFSLCSDIMTVGRIFSSRIFRLQLNILRMRITKVITLLKSLSLRLIRLSRNIWNIPMFLHRYYLPTKSISKKLRNSVKSTVQNLCW